jgi:hypothetical protein
MLTREHIEAVLERIRPFMQTDGGDIELIDVGEHSGVRLDGQVRRLSERPHDPMSSVFPMSREDTMTDLLHLIRAEYQEIPGLHLTKHQVQRLWNVDVTTCEAVLEALETARFLRRTHTGAYVKA